MKIAYVHSTPFPSLAANVVQVTQMCRAFAKLGHDVTLFVPRSPSFISTAEARAAAESTFGGKLPFTVNFVEKNSPRGRLSVLGSIQSTVEELRLHHFDLVYSRNPWSVEFLPRLGMPYIFEIHEERVHLRSKLLNYFLRNHIVRASLKPACRKIVTISGALAETWINLGIPKNKIVTAHDGVDLELFGNPPPQKEAKAHLVESGFPSINTFERIVVYTGAIRQDRGFEYMLNIAARFPRLGFFFVGGSDDEIRRKKALAEKLRASNAVFVGRVAHHDIPTWLAAADILLMMWTWRTPTIRGASPMKLFEYMAAKRLIVGPAFPVICEVVENDKEAVLFRPDDLEAFVAAIQHALHLLDSGQSEKLVQQARAKVEQHYTWNTRSGNILTAAGF